MRMRRFLIELLCKVLCWGCEGSKEWKSVG